MKGYWLMTATAIANPPSWLIEREDSLILCTFCASSLSVNVGAPREIFG